MVQSSRDSFEKRILCHPSFLSFDLRRIVGITALARHQTGLCASSTHAVAPKNAFFRALEVAQAWYLLPGGGRWNRCFGDRRFEDAVNKTASWLEDLEGAWKGESEGAALATR